MQNNLQNLALKHTDSLVAYANDLYPKYLSTPIRVVTDFLDGIINSENNGSLVADKQRSFESIEPFMQMTNTDLRYRNKISYQDFLRSLGASLVLMDEEKDSQNKYPGNQGFEKIDKILKEIVSHLNIDLDELKTQVLNHAELLTAYKQADKFLERFKDGLMQGVPFFEMKKIFSELDEKDLQHFLLKIAKPVVEMNRAVDKIGKLLSKDLSHGLVKEFNDLFSQIDSKNTAAPQEGEFLKMMDEINTGIDKISNRAN